MQPFVTKHGIVVHHHELECPAKRWDSIVKAKVTVYNKNMTVSTISFILTSESFATKLNLMVDHHKQRSVQ